MRSYDVVNEHLYLGSKFLCIMEGGRYKKGMVYSLIDIRHNDHGSLSYGIGDFGMLSHYWYPVDFNARYNNIKLFPIDALTRQERFIYELSGKMPDDLTSDGDE